MPDPTYDSEMSQPVHQPGMENVVNRTASAQTTASDSTSEARDTNGNRVSDDRPQVGPADPATRKKMLDAALGSSSAAPAAAKPVQAKPAPNDGSGIGGRRREAAIMSQVDKDVNGG